MNLFYRMKGKGQKPAKNAPKEAAYYHQRLGERIKALRLQRGYTSYEYFAYDHNISRSQFGRYEKGEDLRFSTLVKIITAFDLTLQEFFSEGFD